MDYRTYPHNESGYLVATTMRGDVPPDCGLDGSTACLVRWLFFGHVNLRLGIFE